MPASRCRRRIKSSASSDGNCGCLFHYCGSSGVYGDSCKTDPYGISEFPPENIILGNAKNLVQFDIILDDAIHNVLETPATYPVLMRKPWNWKMTGLLSVNQMSEFVSLVRQIIHARRRARWK